MQWNKNIDCMFNTQWMHLICALTSTVQQSWCISMCVITVCQALSDIHVCTNKHATDDRQAKIPKETERETPDTQGKTMFVQTLLICQHCSKFTGEWSSRVIICFGLEIDSASLSLSIALCGFSQNPLFSFGALGEWAKERLVLVYPPASCGDGVCLLFCTVQHGPVLGKD